MNTVPPCRICQGPGSGIHYGVNTCVACKVFFRRHLSKSAKPCKAGTSGATCRISHEVAHPCAHCRLQKCEEHGMSKKAIQLGRYTLNKKTLNIVEIKRLAAEKSRVLDLAGVVGDFRTVLMKAHKEFLELWKAPHLLEGNWQKQYGSRIAKFRAGPPLLADMDSEGADTTLVPSHSEFLFSYATFGQTIDDRPKHMQALTNMFENGLRHIVDLMKKIPGFQELCKQDQITIIRQSYLEIMMITRHGLFDVPRRESRYWSEAEKAFCVIRIDKVLSDPALSAMFCMVMKKLQDLKLSAEESCLLKPLTAFYTCHDVLLAPEKAEKIQETSLNSLWHVLLSTHGPEICGLRFAKMIGVLTELKELNHYTQAYLKSYILEFEERKIIKVPPLFRETLLH